MLDLERSVSRACVAVAEKTVLARNGANIGAELIVDCQRCGVFERIERAGIENQIDQQFRARVENIVRNQCQNLPSILAEPGEISPFLPQVREL